MQAQTRLLSFLQTNSWSCLELLFCSSSQHWWTDGCKNLSWFFYSDFETVSVGVGLKWDFSFRQGENSLYFHWREYL